MEAAYFSIGFFVLVLRSYYQGRRGECVNEARVGAAILTFLIWPAFLAIAVLVWVVLAANRMGKKSAGWDDDGR